MQRGFRYKTIRVVVVLTIASVTAFMLVTLRPRAQRQERREIGRLVEVMPARAATLPMMVESYGTVTPREALKLVSEVKGQIVSLHPAFEEGGFVRRGSRLIQVDPRTYQLEVDRRRVQILQVAAELKRLAQEIRNLEASIRIARSNLDLARSEFERLKNLSISKAVSRSTLEKTEQAYLTSLDRRQALENQMALTGPAREQLAAQQDMAAVLLRQAQLDLERTNIAAPFDGWVLEKRIEVGQHVNPGEYLGRIYRDGALEVEVRIPAKDLKWLPPDFNGSPAPPARIVFGSQEGFEQTWRGRVDRMKAEMDVRTRTFQMVVVIDGSDGASRPHRRVSITPGMFVTVQIEGVKIERAFLLPRHVVHPGDVVYTLEDNRLRVKSVHIARRHKNSVYVDRGLSEGELIVTTPLSDAIEGMAVRLRDGTPKTGE